MPFTRYRSPYATAVNKMPSFCAMAKECDIFSFELHSNMLNLHWNDDVFNKRFYCNLSKNWSFTCLSVTKTAKYDHPCIGRKKNCTIFA